MYWMSWRGVHFQQIFYFKVNYCTKYLVTKPQKVESVYQFWEWQITEPETYFRLYLDEISHRWRTKDQQQYKEWRNDRKSSQDQCYGQTPVPVTLPPSWQPSETQPPPSPLNQHTSPSPLTQAHSHWIYTQNCVHYGAPWKVKHDYQLINKVNQIEQWNRICFRLVCLHSSEVTFQTTGYIIHSKIHTSYETW